MNLGIVILNWNGEKLLRQFLPPLIKFTPTKHNIYIIDNGSHDNSIDFVENKYKRIKIIKLDTNYGYAKGYNIGLKNINDEILCLLNNDVEVTENWTDNILKQFDLEPKTAVIQPKLKNYYEKSEFDYAGAAGGYLDKYGYPYCDGRIYKKIEKDLKQYDKIKDIFWACGACFFIRKKIFENHNGFDESFWAHMEEIDLCWRIQNSKYKIRYNHKTEVFHVNAATLNQNNPKKTYLNFRNQLFMITKNSQNILFLLLLEKLLIDAIISVYLIFDKGYKHSLAIIRAYVSFYKHINLLLEFRKKNKGVVKHYQIRSIIFKYLFHKR
ncbi:MAG: dTDP-Rha--alpha-D-GlcNAc-pyrophosphate polyprenol alpha-3-L-rhamnosyltransferase [Flavobacteriaceae bacterium]|nr:dTDP-Rha--alpha-D-GlcNAc-pyrophosphate polyprenol alpha-3-L-rhamnosyltransferase [Flavobacteriaceae bacterium]MAU31436.1 dTDP-Rha--alpha-D-GlcNAc-pyrophosphate polyprenol alpha-3-L-rhamnosyltransferase [Flavobacteriaceae bacterium]|tara:strand:+ start:11198 stop:12172 length:975 start_codon:yes stop_codon:yes gene_type:complete